MAWQTIAAPVAGAFASGIAGKIFGGSKGKSPTDADFRRAYRDEARQDRNIERYSTQLDTINQYWTASTQAPKYGIHPLVAAGMQPYNQGSGGVGAYYGGGKESNIPDAIGQAAGQAVLNTDKTAEQRAKDIHDASLEEIRSRTALNQANAYRANTFANQQLIDSAGNRAAQNRNGQQDQNIDALAGTTVKPNVKKLVDPRGKVHDVKFGTPAQEIEDTLGEAMGAIQSIETAFEHYKGDLSKMNKERLDNIKRYRNKLLKWLDKSRNKDPLYRR
jgi:hypothetical protein